jgi:site-specific recombinase
MRDSAREVVLIVLGVVIAFGVDARWEDALERRTELRVLRSIQSEMAENQLRLDQAIQVRISARQAAETLLGMTGPEAEPQLMTVVDSLLRAADRGVATYDPVTGSTDALVPGGQLSSISSDSLRLALVSWPEQLREPKR